MTSELSRRGFLRVVITAAGTVVLPVACGTPAPRFFSEAEGRALGALADHVFPPDDTPGAAALGAVEYIETLLTAFETDPPRIFAGGPFSGRAPLPAADGGPSDRFPDNQFLSFLPLTPEQERAWRLRLYGSAGVPGGGPNDALLGPIKGLRALIREGLAQAMDLFPGEPLESLDPAALAQLWGLLPDAFTHQLTVLVIESVFAAPEYGGNRDQGGWRLIHFAGDTAPLGYTLFDGRTGTYRERPDAPVTTKDPGPEVDPMDEETHKLLRLATSVLGGKVFY